MGIFLGSFAHVRSSIAARNVARGIRTFEYSVIQGNTAAENSGIGIETRDATVIGNAIFQNDSVGLQGAGATGYAHNTLIDNDTSSGFANADGVWPMHPNACNGCPFP
jgi:hypothetical protein